MKHQCTDCHRPIPAGGAVLRGNGHRLVAWCRACGVAAGLLTLPLPAAPAVAVAR